MVSHALLPIRNDNYSPSDLSIDAMDVSGDHQLDVLHSVYKQRLSVEGTPINEEPEQYQLQDEGEGAEKGAEKADVKEIKKEEDKETCGRSVCLCVCQQC